MVKCSTIATPCTVVSLTFGRASVFSFSIRYDPVGILLLVLLFMASHHQHQGGVVSPHSLFFVENTRGKEGGRGKESG